MSEILGVMIEFVCFLFVKAIYQEYIVIWWLYHILLNFAIYLGW